MTENYETIPPELIEMLRETTDFYAYAKLLKEAAMYAPVAVVSSDTPTGPHFTQRAQDAINDIGFAFDFSNSFRKSVAGLTYKGQLIFGEISSDIINRYVDFETFYVRIQSTNHSINGEALSFVSIDENGISSPFRGLTFYVLLLQKRQIVSMATFDTFEKVFKKYQLHSDSMFITDFISNHKELTVIGIKFPWLNHLNPALYTENEKFISDNKMQHAMADNVWDERSILTKLFPDTEDYKSVTTIPPSYRDIFGVRKFYDYESRLVNCKNGIRVTPNAPETYKRGIYIAGNCILFGVGSSDAGTIASYLQNKLNDECPELEFCVFNYGYLLSDSEESDVAEVVNILNYLPAKPGDIVITLFEYGMDEYIDGESIKRPYKYGDIFYDNSHLTEAGNHSFADMIFDKLKERNFYPETAGAKTEIAKTPRRDNLNLTPEDAAKLSQYTAVLDNIAGLLEIKPSDNIGAIVMNCNPFTNGHRYLIETAAAQVKYLIIFVVEEDKSDFPFADRYELVQAATEDLENVFAVPSGRFIISSLTFSEYFNKKDIGSMSVNPSNDVRMFGGQLAPHLFIKVRFAGEEPLDPVTRRYNREMEAVLPQYGIKFIEIPRKETDGNVISASRVRELLKTRDFEAIAKLVPEVTLHYLMEKYND
jgi:[citrate (pro-3S)-lyase] ligase